MLANAPRLRLDGVDHHKSFAQRLGLSYNAPSIDREVHRVMADIVWAYIVSAFVLVAFAALSIGARWGRLGADPVPVHCPSCETPMSARRLSIFKAPIGLGEWMCPHCRTRMDKRGKNLSETAS